MTLRWQGGLFQQFQVPWFKPDSVSQGRTLGAGARAAFGMSRFSEFFGGTPVQSRDSITSFTAKSGMLQFG